MRHFYIIKEYRSFGDYYVCEDEEGAPHNITFNKLYQNDPYELINKRISYSYTIPYISIAVGVKLEN